jgi:hypothetical protein
LLSDRDGYHIVVASGTSMYGPSLDHGELIGGGHFEPSGWEPRPRIPFSAGACATRIMLLVRTSSIPEQMLRILRLAFRRAMIVANVALRLRSPFGIARTPLNMSRDTHAKANLSAVFVRQLNLLIGSHTEGIDTNSVTSRSNHTGQAGPLPARPAHLPMV